MNWREKLAILRNKLEQDEQFFMECDIHDGASQEFIDSVRQRFPFVDEDYLDFLQITDGGRFENHYFCGSGTRYSMPEFVVFPDRLHSPSLFVEVEKLNRSLPEWRDMHELGDYLPIGSDGNESNSLAYYYLMLADQSIMIIDCENRDKSIDQKIANSFSEFLGEVLIGPLFPLMYYDSVDEWKEIMENDWTRFLREQGWWFQKD